MEKNFYRFLVILAVLAALFFSVESAQAQEALGKSQNQQISFKKRSLFDNPAYVSTLFYRDYNTGREIHIYFLVFPTNAKLKLTAEKIIQTILFLDEKLLVRNYFSISAYYPFLPSQVVFFDFFQEEKSVKVVIRRNKEMMWKIFQKETAEQIASEVLNKLSETRV